LHIHVHHFPTTDHVEVSDEQANAICARLDDLVTKGRIVLVGCSAAEGRTGDVLRRWRRRLPDRQA
jgi:protein-tyrosine phosphatase